MEKYNKDKYENPKVTLKTRSSNPRGYIIPKEQQKPREKVKVKITLPSGMVVEEEY